MGHSPIWLTLRELPWWAARRICAGGISDMAGRHGAGGDHGRAKACAGVLAKALIAR